jgi:quinol monooxygenase YgiN
MAVFRILEAKARPGAVDRVTELLVQQQRDIVAAAPGAVFAQSLRSGDQVLAVSSWESDEHMQRYLDQEVTRDFYRALPELLMGTPSVRTYEVVDGGQAGGGWADAGPAGDGVDHDGVDHDGENHDGADADGAAR